MASPIGSSGIHPILLNSLYLFLIVAFAVAVMVWAWYELFIRIREAEAEFGKWPKFAATSLIVASALTTAGVIYLFENLPPTETWSWDAVSGTASISLFVLLPAVGLVLIAVLARLDRSFGWTRFLADRQRHQVEQEVEQEHRTSLLDTIHAGLEPPILALENAQAELHRQQPLPPEAAAVLVTLETQLTKIRRVRDQTDVPPSQGAASGTSLGEAIDEAISRYEAIEDDPPDIRCFGEDGIHLHMQSHHLSVLLWSLLGEAVAHGDPKETVVEILYKTEGPRFIIELSGNGFGSKNPVRSHDRLMPSIEQCHAIVAMYGGHILPESPPYGTSFAVVLDARLAQVAIKPPRTEAVSTAASSA